MKNEFLRHTLSTIAYRFQKAVNNTKTEFGNFSAGNESRTSNEIINHMCHVLSATRIFIVEEKYNKELPERFELKLEIDRFNAQFLNTNHQTHPPLNTLNRKMLSASLKSSTSLRREA